jgi:hypothetical protein
MSNKITPSRSSQPAWGRQSRAQTGFSALLLGCAAFFSAVVWASDQSTEHPTAPFKDLTLRDWEERSFSGNSRYEIVNLGGTRVLKGSTDSAASILYKKDTIDLTKTPTISWSWKINGIYNDVDEQTRQGDDFPARLYVVVQTGLLPWETLAINYVWSSSQELGTSWTSPFTEKSKMLAVQSGRSNAGKWVNQSRNIVADFKELFGEEVEEIDGYAVMIDGDNANKKGTAWFAEINFQAE